MDSKATAERSVLELLRPYLPSDRLEAVLAGATLPERTRGAVLFADISGFTPLTEALDKTYGARRGGEELTQYLNDVYGALIGEVTRSEGSVIGFSGDAIMCWFELDNGLRATGCAGRLQRAMDRFRSIPTPSGATLSLAIKVSVASGAARRFVVGDPDLHVLDVLTGAPLDRVARAEVLAEPGEIVVSKEVANVVGPELVAEWRKDAAGTSFGVLEGVNDALESSPSMMARSRVPGPVKKPTASPELLRPWLLPAVYERIVARQGHFLAELRPVVALFLKFGGLDFDGDDAVGEKLDAYVRWTQHVLRRYEGALIQLTTGDKGSYLYASFGAPLAQEHVLDRALQAALALRSPPPDLSFIGETRIGISSGRMRTGAYGSEHRRTYGVLGDETNVAARLMEKAVPGQVLVTERLAREMESAYRFESIGTVKLKGKQAVPLFELVEEQHLSGSMRRAKRHGESLVGRKKERAFLREALTALGEGGAGLTVILEGEAGIGKSRLVRDLVEAVAEVGALKSVTTTTDPIERTTPYYAWRKVYRHLFGIEHMHTPDEIRARIFERLPDALAQLSPLLDAVLPVDLPPTAMTADLEGGARANALPRFLTALFVALSARAPFVLIVEDAHWLDSASWTLLEGVSRVVPSLLLVLTTRPLEDPPPQYRRIRERATTRHLALEAMPRDDATALVATRLGVETLPEAVAELILAKAEGNPFFAEELAFALRDAGAIRIENGVCHLDRAVQQLDVPDTIEGVVTSRIDRLGPSQQLALKVASVLGRVFSRAVLQEVFPVPDDRPKIPSHVERLAALDLTPREETDEPDEYLYAFKHAVTLDVTYNLMLFEQRGELHGVVADWYERKHAEDLEPYYGVLAHHRYMAIAGQARVDDTKRQHAIIALARAAKRSLETGATPEALDHAKKGLALLESMAESRERSSLELDLRLVLGASLVASRGPHDEEVRRELARARELCKELGEITRLFEALFGIWYAHLTSTERLGALEFSRQALEVAKVSGHPALLLLAHHARGATEIHEGDFAGGLENMRGAIAIADQSTKMVGALSHARNPTVIAYCYTAWASWFLGYPQRALEDSQKAMDLATAVAHPLTLTQAMCFGAQVRRYRKDIPEAMELAKRAHALATEHQLPYWLRVAEELLGWLSTQMGDPAACVERLGRIAAQDRAANFFALTNMVILGDLADALSRVGRCDDAAQVLEEAKSALETRLVGSCEAEILRVEGDLFLKRGDERKAALGYLRAASVARKQQARSLELRTLLAHARIDKSTAPNARLAEVYATFDEGHDTADLIEAKELLARHPSS